MKIFNTAVALLLLLCQLKGQYISGVTLPDTTQNIVLDSTDLSYKYASTITGEELEAYLTIIASDEFEGRETGENGNNIAADYIADQIEKIGLAAHPSLEDYAQKVAFTFTRWNDVKLEVNGNVYKNLWDFLAFPTQNEMLKNYNVDEVVFLGYGIETENYSDYKGKSIEGKTIMFYAGDPKDKDGNSRITKSSMQSDWDAGKKLKLAKKKGAKMAFIIESDIKKFLQENRKFLLGGSVELGDKRKEELPTVNHMYISSTVAKDIMGDQTKKAIKSRDRITKKGKSCQVKLKSPVQIDMDKRQTVILSQNLMGFIEGGEKKDEIVVVSAHYDHIGKKGKDIFNGADDNGTGTTTLLELSQAMKQAKDEGNGPKRSVLFLWVTGEEKGLLGSEYYASNPIYPLENTIADINIDMIGRRDTEHEHDNYIYVIGSDRLSTDLHKINEAVNQKYTQMELDYTYNDENDPNRYYYRSDHYNFAKNGIPSIFFFSGVHEDYHGPGDTVDKIQFDKMERTARHIFHLLWDLANRDEKIRVDGEVK